mmetsp:Transcript_82711/g.183744  ORF Transcript_82711/g.183744 Transcript_82711/m.183744 type:complete len:212 (+) Transcript_82711:1392-2027(+)
MHCSAEIPAAGNEVHYPEKADGMLDYAHPSKGLQPSPQLWVLRAEGGDFRKPEEACQLRQAQEAPDAGHPSAEAKPLGDLFPGAQFLLGTTAGQRKATNQIHQEHGPQISTHYLAEAHHLLARCVPIGKEKVHDQVYTEEPINDKLRFGPVIVRLITLRNLKLKEAHAEGEERAGVEQEYDRDRAPKSSERAGLAHHEPLAIPEAFLCRLL